MIGAFPPLGSSIKGMNWRQPVQVTPKYHCPGIPITRVLSMQKDGEQTSHVGAFAVSEENPNYCGLSGGDSGSWGWFRTCQYQYHHPQNSPTQKVTEKIIKIQGVNATPTQRKKKKPVVKASFLGESMYTVIGVQGGQVT